MKSGNLQSYKRLGIATVVITPSQEIPPVDMPVYVAVLTSQNGSRLGAQIERKHTPDGIAFPHQPTDGYLAYQSDRNHTR